MAAVEQFALHRRALLFLFLFGVAEATLLPIVGDIPLLLFALLVPSTTLRSFAAFTAGAVAGSLLLFLYAATDYTTVEAMIRTLPGIGASDFSTVRALLEQGGIGAFVQFGPGIPVKVDVAVSASMGISPLLVAVGVVMNRVSRIAPTLIAAAVVGRLAPRLVRRFPTLLLAAYALGWLGLYLLYWNVV